MNTKLNKTDYIILGVYYAISIILNLFDFYNDDKNLMQYVIDIPMFQVTSILGVVSFLYWLIPNFLIKEKKMLHFIFLGLVVIILIGIVERLLFFISGDIPWSKFPTAYYLVLYAAFDGSNSIGLPLGILLTKKFYESQSQILTIQKQQKENELKLLRSQIDPHFLFNNLNTLDALIDSNPEKAKEYINRLSLIYRYLIKTKDAEVIELTKEVEFVSNYIFLIKTRFGPDYEFEIEENVALQDKFIPTGALQTLLENVVKHNKSDSKTAIKTTIKINSGWIKVENTKSNLKPKNESFGTGLDNLKSRYQLITDKEIKIEESETHFLVAIPIINLTN